jgi:transposase
MEARTMSLPPAASHDDAARCLLAIELSKKSWIIAVHLAWMWLQHQLGSSLSVWFHNRVGKLKGRIRRITIVAVARKLLIALWRYLETGLVPDGAILKI